MQIPSPPQYLNEALRWLHTFFQQHGSDAPYVVAQALCIHFAQITKIQLISEKNIPLTVVQWQNISSAAIRHAQHEPLAYILGKKEFYGRDFIVNPHTLIPRPESEDLLETLFALLKKRENIKPLFFADIGTGSGCLACTFAAEISHAHGFMLDINPLALEVAKQNAQHLKVSNKVQALQGTLYHLPFRPNSLDVLISNPPYISEAEYVGLEKNVRHFEPKTALVPLAPKTHHDPFGLAHIDALAQQAGQLLRDGGICLIEHGSTQGAAVRELFLNYSNWKSVVTGKDLAGLDRFCLCIK